VSNVKHETPDEKRVVPAVSVKKVHWKPGTMLAPAPVVLVSCQVDGKRPNIITIAWAGTVFSDPPMLSIAIRPSRHSYELVRKSREFVVNLPSIREIKATDKCGVLSGRDVDKFAAMGLTPAPAKYVRAPIIAECPINIECKVHHILPLGSHALFIAEIKGVQVTADLVTKGGRLAIEQARLFAFAHGHYFALGKLLGYFGFSVRKRRRR
jgi:flavin reductase (DIM6/NTAB) family NADH-FMN oxidoreductase RutF